MTAVTILLLVAALAALWWLLGVSRRMARPQRPPADDAVDDLAFDDDAADGQVRRKWTRAHTSPRQFNKQLKEEAKSSRAAWIASAKNPKEYYERVEGLAPGPPPPRDPAP